MKTPLHGQKGLLTPGYGLLAEAVSNKKNFAIWQILIGFSFNPKLKLASWFNNQQAALPSPRNLVAYILVPHTKMD